MSSSPQPQLIAAHRRAQDVRLLRSAFYGRELLQLARAKAARERRAAARLAEGEDLLVTSSEEEDRAWRKRMRKEEEEDKEDDVRRGAP